MMPNRASDRLEQKRNQDQADWRSEPATEKQLKELEFFNIPVDASALTKGRASDLIEAFAKIDPKQEKKYRSRPATTHASQAEPLRRWLPSKGSAGLPSTRQDPAPPATRDSAVRSSSIPSNVPAPSSTAVPPKILLTGEFSAATEQPSPIPSPTPRFPIVIRSSVRALYAEYVREAIVWTFWLLLVIAITWYNNVIDQPGAHTIIAWLWGIFILLFSFSLVRLWFAYRRIKNTAYRIFPDKIEVTSHLFRFLGTYNHAVNLTQLRQIQGFRNSRLDVWFFKCGGVALTVSGDKADFRMCNLYRPEMVKRQIEEVAFGKASSQYAAEPAGESTDR